MRCRMCRCSGARVMRRTALLARRLRRRPVPFTAHSPIGPVRLTLGERELATIAYGAGDPRVYGLLPAAVGAALRGDFALLRRMATVARIDEVSRLFADPALSSIAAAAAIECHDYARPYSVADAPADRRAA